LGGEIGDTSSMSQRPGSPITHEQLAALPPEFQALLHTVVGHFGAQLTGLKAEVAELKAEIARWKKTPWNSSLPPSRQHPHAKPTPKKPKSKRERGGQPDHAKRERPLCRATIATTQLSARTCHASARTIPTTT